MRIRLVRALPATLILAAACLLASAASPQPADYSLSFSTYLGGSSWEHARDVAVDRDGNIIVVGGTASEDFPTTPGAFQRKLGAGGTDAGSGGYSDGFVAKFSPVGKLLWSTYLGGPNYDRVYGVEVDREGYIYLTGRAGPGFPVTPGVFQPRFQGGGYGNPGIYGKQNCFAAKMTPDGSRLVWASYAGVGSLCRDLALDSQGSLYLTSGYLDSPFEPPAAWFANAYQKTRRGKTEMGVMKVTNDGRSVVWATWLGGSGAEGVEASVRVDHKGYVYLAGFTDSDDIPTTPGAAFRHRLGGVDFYVARLSPDGSKLVYGTYLGSSQDDFLSTHNLAIDEWGDAYVTFPTGPDFRTTTDVLGSKFFGGKDDIGVAKLSPTGALLAATFVGGNGEENADGISVDPAGNVYISGSSSSTDFPTTPRAFQRTSGGGTDAVFFALSADFHSLLYATYLGGRGFDNGRSSFLDGQGNFYLVGATDSADWPVKNAFQPSYAGGKGLPYGSGDAILAKFSIDTTRSRRRR